ncbi:MAG: endonuclease domain-containing protein [Armatimonadetes bacterium]|nr:endonuclease domain-containing protein [Armatimonadota bacterium]
MRRTASERAKTNAKVLRRHMTGPEKVLWSRLREWRNRGYTIRRQHPIGPYVVDFVCMERRVVIEVDGVSHDSEQLTKDAARDALIKSLGFLVIRISNDDVLHQTDAVLTHIWAVLEGG